MVEVTIRGFMKDGEPWFVAKDVTDALGYTNGRKAVADHIDEDQKGVTSCYTPGGRQQKTIISEGGLYALIMGSKLPQAREFRRWVLDTVLEAQSREEGGSAAVHRRLRSRDAHLAKEDGWTVAVAAARVDATSPHHHQQVPLVDHHENESIPTL